ncbi:UNVERIFIED_ORG: NAD(P)-dependent dehydrogenase (short-subunit alcohol dehydrogenase family) [Nocardia globerula]|uniref:3-oxoacyl-[acyl-carrier-protein] reductase MabA n=2 Tax=Nocardiaceae TaxID=85025 RepID=A0A652YHG4_NOCGL|nr:NAD(P)-dependent dehydrogenase (short-subunit alcohol dehydrogenase family) [Rhodococcus globerulus]
MLVMKRVAVVTGGGSGIGSAICQRLGADGYAVAVLDLNGDGAELTAKEIVAAGGQAVGYQLDVSDRTDVDRVLGEVRAELGSVSVLVTSAAVAIQEPFAEISVESWNRIMAINLTGTFNCAQSVLPEMVESGWGRVVFISSSSAQRGGPKMAHYAASKGGVIALTKTLALEYSPLGVTINNISPSSIDTPSVRRKQEAGLVPSNEVMGRHIPVGRMGTGADIAGACAYLCSDDASFVTGQTVSVNGGSYLA